MSNVSQFFIGIIILGLGVLVVKYTFNLVNITGSQGWLERYTGPGSTYGMYKIFGVLLAVFGIIYATGLGDNVLQFIFSPFTSLFAPLAK